MRLPNQYAVRTGAALATQDTNETSVELKVQTQKGVDLNFTSVDLTMSLDDFSDRVLEPAMSVLAASIEADAMLMYQDVANQVNSQGAPATFQRVLQGRKILVDNLAPLGGRTANLNTQDNMDLVDALKGLFNDSDAVSRQYREGYMGRTAGFDFMENTLWPAHLRGGGAGYATNTLPTVLPVSPNPVNAITVATGTGSLAKGAVITITGVMRVHPETKANTGVQQQFVVTQAHPGGAGVVQISPPIITAGPMQTVTLATTNAAAGIQVAGVANTAHGLSLLYHKSAFAFATADLVMPKGVDFAARQVFDGISMRIVRQYDINSDRFPCRLDVLYGYRTLRPQLACRLACN